MNTQLECDIQFLLLVFHETTEKGHDMSCQENEYVNSPNSLNVIISKQGWRREGISVLHSLKAREGYLSLECI